MSVFHTDIGSPDNEPVILKALYQAEICLRKKLG